MLNANTNYRLVGILDGIRRLGFAAFLVLVSGAGGAYAQTAPVISNVTAEQRNDASRIVDVFYNLDHFQPTTVWVVFSDDGGTSWRIPAKTLTGDLGNNVAPGADKHIIWDAGADIPGVVGTYRARVYADDASSQGNMVFVAEGSFPFQRGSPVYVGPFWIDKYEVTNQRYAEFLNDADPAGDYWDSRMEISRLGNGALPTFYVVNSGRQNYPIRYVSAYDAEAYAAWLSAREGRTYRLPGEGAWEKAAAWDPVLKKHWLYGFQSDSITCADANYNPCGIGEPTPVGHYNGITAGTNDSKSPYGAYDMSGNVWEWTSSGSPSRVIRGGAWGDAATDCQTTNRYTASPTDRGSYIGFRVVLDVN